MSIEPGSSKISNQTITSVPSNVEQPDVLKRFLSRLIEELDLVLGYRGADTYATEAELAAATASAAASDEEATTTLADISEDVAANEEDIETLTATVEATDTAVAANTQAVSDINTVLASTVLSSTYHDFDNVAYATLTGKNEFNTLGSNLSNAPYTPVGGETYYNYLSCLVTDNAGVVQILRAYSTTTLVPTTYFRIGNTWSKAVSLGWT